MNDKTRTYLILVGFLLAGDVIAILLGFSGDLVSRISATLWAAVLVFGVAKVVKLL